MCKIPLGATPLRTANLPPIDDGEPPRRLSTDAPSSSGPSSRDLRQSGSPMTPETPLLSRTQPRLHVPESGGSTDDDNYVIDMDSISSSDDGDMEEISLSDDTETKESGGADRRNIDGTGRSTPTGEVDPSEIRLSVDSFGFEGGGGVTPAEIRGPGGCCMARAKQVLKAGLTQAAATALTFGTKPLVEAAVLSIFSLTPVGATSLAATLTAALVGGVYAGAIHTAVSSSVSGLMNSALSANVYDVREGSNALSGEIATIDLPVMAAFVTGYTVRGAVGVSPEIWVDALSKGITSTIAGSVQGMITDALRQTMAAFEVVYKEKPAKDLSGTEIDFIKKTFADKMNPLLPDRKQAGHDIIGKTLGSALGMGLTQLLADREMDSTTSGCVGMLTYLTSWFSGIHLGSLAMDNLFSGTATPDSGGSSTIEGRAQDELHLVSHTGDRTGLPEADLAHFYPFGPH